jgi:cell division protein YceG involved in septum cleavage
MGKEKVIDKTAEAIANVSGNPNSTTNMIMQYLPIVLALVALVICYLLFKRMQSLNSQSDSLENIEKQFTNFVKEQSEINTLNAKRFNQLVSQMNQVSYVVQNNNNTRELNTVTTQMSPEREVTQPVTQLPKVKEVMQQEPEVSKIAQRQMMPTSVIQTNFPISNAETRLPAPMNTSNKKETVNVIDSISSGKDLNKASNKKVIEVQTLKEEVLIEEASSEDEA